jgi:hypothetical protein
MFKLIYASLAFLFSTAVVLFTQKDPVVGCKHEITGVVALSQDSPESAFVILGTDNKVYRPEIKQGEAILVQGQKIRVCYDTIGTGADKSITISVNSTVVLP